MLIHTSKLIEIALDWAVADCLGGHSLYFDTVCTFWITLDGKDRALGNRTWAQSFAPSTDGAEAVPIIDREGINIGTQRNEPGFRPHPDRKWHAQIDRAAYVAYGPTFLIAGMRCFVRSRRGDAVDVPEELLSRCSPTTLAALGLASQAANIRQEASRAGL